MNRKDYLLGLMCGIDIPIPELQLTVHQPKMKEIALIGTPDFLAGAQTLCISKNLLAQGETLLAELNNFQILMMIMAEKEAADKREAVKKVFQLILPDYQILLTVRSIICNGKNGESILIDESNFDAFQEVLKDIFCANSGPSDIRSFNPADAKAKEIADKLLRARARVAAQKKDGGNDVLATYISTLSVGLQIPMDQCINMTMFQMFDLIERFGLYTSWDLDIRSRLAGGKPDSQPDNWMKSIH